VGRGGAKPEAPVHSGRGEGGITIQKLLQIAIFEQ